MPLKDDTCWVCGERGLVPHRNSTIPGNLTSGDFAITDSGYGVTGAIFRCPSCEHLQCPDLNDVLPYYLTLQDSEYEDGREERYLQAKRLLKAVLQELSRENGNGLRLLDVGAGSGVLLEAAVDYGFDAIGVEPCSWLADIAINRGLTVHQGVLPHPAVHGVFDVVTAIDVIEHVATPFELLQSIHSHTSPSGIAVLVTPDVSSFFARILGFKWWHYRIAHISYFNKSTLRHITQRAGFRCRKFSRPSWYFAYGYLRVRLLRYLPSWVLPSAKGPLRNIVIPLNLRDSLMVVCEPAKP